MAAIPSPGLLPASDRVDLVQSTPPVSLTGMARIAMIAGVPSVSINGGAYTSFGTGGAAPTGEKVPFSRLIPSDRLDIVQGNPPVSPLGLGRLACIAGAPSLSVEGAAYASLGSAGSAPTRGPFPGFLPPTDYIDLIQGNPPVSNPGTARIACFPGATTLSISVEGAAYAVLGASVFVPPVGFTALLGYSASNIDGLANSSLVDGQGLGTVLNLGSVAGANITQASAPLRPTFIKNVGAQINGKSAMRAAGAQSMASAAFAAQAQPITWFCLYRSNVVGVQVFFGTLASQEIFFATGGPLSFYAGTSAPTALQMIAGKYHSITCNFNGAGSVASMDGVTTGALACGAQGLSQLTMFSDATPGNFLNGDIVEQWGYASGAAPSIAQWNAAVLAYYGVTPS